MWDQSRTARVLRAVEKGVTRASRGSAVIAAAESLVSSAESVVRHSVCYRWLTADPDPSVVVIDLRETYTVGPFVRLLERVVEPVKQAWTDSRLASLSAAVGAGLSHSRTGQVLATLLEPPEPPERENDEKTE